MNFRVGQKVVCVDASPKPTLGIAWTFESLPIREGEIYTIVGTETRGGFLGVYLHEVKSNGPPFNDGGERSFWPFRFRPIIEKKTDISIFTEMLKPKQRELISP